jgi:alpha-aminoadipic semialdehyde synthase
LIIGFAGYGNVSMGAQEILNLLPIKDVSPGEMNKIYDDPSNRCLYKVVFKEEDMVEPILSNDSFDLQDYYQFPKKYKSIFEKYIPKLTILMNCIYWDNKYPRLITKDYVKKNYSKRFNLQVIGDISIDINGAIEFTEKATTPDNPIFVYNPFKDTIKDGYNAEGIIVMGIDNLPCELPKESSHTFSNTLHNYVSDIVKTDFSQDFKKCIMPSVIKKAIILYHGKLTPNYQYMDKYL